jgi:hypothetical protein
MVLSLILFVFLPICLVSLALALIPWRPLVLRVLILVALLVATVLLPVHVPLRWEVWLYVLGPGAAVAIFRILFAIDEIWSGRQRGTAEDRRPGESA